MRGKKKKKQLTRVPKGEDVIANHRSIPHKELVSQFACLRVALSELQLVNSTFEHAPLKSETVFFLWLFEGESEQQHTRTQKRKKEESWVLQGWSRRA
jgi:hypothetical protein